MNLLNKLNNTKLSKQDNLILGVLTLLFIGVAVIYIHMGF